MKDVAFAVGLWFLSAVTCFIGTCLVLVALTPPPPNGTAWIVIASLFLWHVVFFGLLWLSKKDKP